MSQGVCRWWKSTNPDLRKLPYLPGEVIDEIHSHVYQREWVEESSDDVYTHFYKKGRMSLLKKNFLLKFRRIWMLNIRTFFSLLIFGHFIYNFLIKNCDFHFFWRGVESFLDFPKNLHIPPLKINGIRFWIFDLEFDFFNCSAIKISLIVTLQALKFEFRYFS